MNAPSLGALALSAVIMLPGCQSAGQPAAVPPGGTGTGCPSSAQAVESTSIGIVIGNRANTKLASQSLLACYLDPALNRPSHIIVAVADGQPTAVFDDRLPSLAEGRTRNERYAEFTERLRVALTVPADQPEADILEATAVVARGLRDDQAPRQLLINDSLLQTTGALPLQQGYLYSDPVDVVDELGSYLARSVGDLSGFEIVLLAPGAVAEPQVAVTADNRARIVSLSSAIFRSLGAKVTIDPGTIFVPPTREPANRPKVTVIPMTPPQPPEEPARRCREVLDSRRVTFVSDSAEFLNPIEAKATIDAVAERIVDCPGRIRLTGTTSSAGTKAGRKKVSTARARAVRMVLASALRVDPRTIRAVGVGMNFDGYIDDRRPDGTLDSVKAQQNRLVIIEVNPA